MCKYCQKENRLKMSTLYSVSQNTELEQENVSLEITEEQSLLVNSYCWDTLRKTYLGIAASFNIEYCPWCGRRLSEV